MKFFLNNWRWMFHLALVFVVLPFGLWWLVNRMQFFVLPFPFYIFASLILWLALFALYTFIEYLVRGYIIYQNHGDLLVYKERGKEEVGFSIVLRSTDEEYYAGGNLYIPTGENWKKDVPDWAKERRDIIAERLKKHFQNDKSVWFIED